ncbi:uncharacterized protein AB675_11014 [Cyphellophora attinorum]|uniref:Increased recombination centers protein 6 n=1 Tax=Cyphellophora attinorum TaxID=1664694 RepID=A0A0N1H2L8_9EURO|nr:uncharacterized protein AB675_11014 [Phialophora attinorum]KPI35524.1 hypothetical protein AB675_11014 [Phialophora attinorum]
MAPAEASLSQLRLLILSPANASKSTPSAFPPVLKYLTATAPSENVENFAGYTSHVPIRLRTKYYTKDVSLWCDELPDLLADGNKANEGRREEGDGTAGTQSNGEDGTTLDEWQEQMLSAAAAEVRSVIGGIILIMPIKASTKLPIWLIDYVRAVHSLREAIEDDSPGRDIASAVILQPEAIPMVQQSSVSSVLKALDDTAEALSSECLENDMLGWDVVHWLGDDDPSEVIHTQTGPRNEFGERIGIARIFEVLESVDWSAAPDPTEETEDGAAGDTGSLGRQRLTGLDDELQEEMLGLKLSMMEEQALSDDEAGGEDLSIEQMEQLQGRILAIREAASGMSGSQKELFAQREIDRIMKEL